MAAHMNGVGSGSFLDPADTRTNRIVWCPAMVTPEHLWQSSKYPVTETHGIDRGKRGQRTRAGSRHGRGYSRLSPKAFKPWRRAVTTKIVSKKKKKKGRKNA